MSFVSFSVITLIFLIVRVHFALLYLNVGVDKMILHVGNFVSINDLRFNNFSTISLDVYLLISFVPTCKIIYDGFLLIIGLQ